MNSHMQRGGAKARLSKVVDFDPVVMKDAEALLRMRGDLVSKVTNVTKTDFSHYLQCDQQKQPRKCLINPARIHTINNCRLQLTQSMEGDAWFVDYLCCGNTALELGTVDASVCMADVAIIAKVDRSNVETHCAFCLEFFAGEEAHGRWEYFLGLDGFERTGVVLGLDEFERTGAEYDGEQDVKDHSIQFLMCPTCRDLGGIVYGRYADCLFVQLPSECRLFKVNTMDGVNY